VAVELLRPHKHEFVTVKHGAILMQPVVIEENKADLIANEMGEAFAIPQCPDSIIPVSGICSGAWTDILAGAAG
jgi:hypothetical protein